jgi:hypothetical protein
MQRSDAFAVLVAIFVLGAGAYLSTFSAEVIRWAGLVLMAGAIIGLIIWFAWGRTSQATWTADGKVAGGKTRIALGAALLCVLLGGGYVGSHWPTAFLRTQAPSNGNASPSGPVGPIASRLDHFILRCNRPLTPVGKTVEQSLADLNEFKRKLDIIGDAMGLAFTMVTIRGGVRLDIDVVSDEAKQRTLPLSAAGVTKMTMEVRRIDNKTEIVSLFIKLPPQLSFYGWIPPNPLAPDTITMVIWIEQFLGAPRGTCSVM